MAKLRADQMLVDRGLAESRARAQALILAGLVFSGERKIEKAGQAIAADAPLEVRGRDHPWVSRGGVKLEAALAVYPVEITGRVCLDVGASTGGFTEVLLARGARRVYAVDVGRDQLHARLRAHPAVVSMEQTDIRALPPAALAEPPDFAVVDVSFISLKHVLPGLSSLLAPHSAFVALIKPQFEAGRRDVKKGIVRDPAVHEAVCADIGAAVIASGWSVAALLPSPIAGGDGNREFFIAAER